MTRENHFIVIRNDYHYMLIVNPTCFRFFSINYINKCDAGDQKGE